MHDIRYRRHDERDWTPDRLFLSLMAGLFAAGVAIWILAVIGALYLVGWAL